MPRYTVVVTNVAGSVTSTVASLTVWVTPAITAQPQSRTNLAGTTANFSVTATGTAPLAYQWRFNGTNLAGATASNYPIASVQLSNAGNYTVVVTNVAGSVTSAVAVLTVTTQSQAVVTFNNTNLIQINDAAAATPYPSAIVVLGQTGTVGKVAVVVWDELGVQSKLAVKSEWARRLGGVECKHGFDTVWLAFAWLKPVFCIQNVYSASGSLPINKLVFALALYAP